MTAGLIAKRRGPHFQEGLSIIVAVLLAGALSSVSIAQVKTTEPARQSSADSLEEAHGKRLYVVNCAPCHDSGQVEAPLAEALRKLTADHILRSMNEGSMIIQVGHLSASERQAIATYLGTPSAGSKIPDHGGEVGYCAEGHDVDAGKQEVKVGDWGFGLTNERSIPNGRISPENVGSLELDWVFAFPNSARARAQPTVAGDTLFTASQNGKIYALDLDCGCIRWEFEADAEVRSAISIDTDENGNAVRLYFGDFKGNVYGLDIATRRLLWKIRADSHPIATITGSLRLHKDSVYVPVSSLEVVSAVNPNYPCCTFRGSVLAIDKMTGKTRWQTYTVDEPLPQGVNSAGATRYGPSGAPIWSSPTIDEKRGLLYIGTGENYTRPSSLTSDSIIALSLETGEFEWVNQVTLDDVWNGGCNKPDPANCPENHGPDYDFGAPPMLEAQGPGSTHICYIAPKADPIDGRFVKNGATWESLGKAMVDMRGVGYMYGYLRDLDGLMLEVEHAPEPNFEGPMWIGHVATATPDLTRTLEFYQKVLGFEHYRRADSLKGPTYDDVVGFEGVELHGGWFRVAPFYSLEFWQFTSPVTKARTELPPLDRIGYNLIAMETTDIDADFARLKSQGLILETGIVDTQDGQAFYFRDPDGNLLALMEFAPGSKLSLNALNSN